MEPYKIMVTGHRPNKIGGYKQNPVATYIYRWLGIQLIKQLNEHEKIECISGMALGVDIIFATIVKLLKEKHPDKISLIAALPYENHGSNWPILSQEYHKTILESCNEAIVVCRGSHANFKLLQRDEWMVNRANLVLAVWNGDCSGGTYHTIKYAQAKNKEIIYIDQKKLNVFVSIAKRLDQLDKESN